MQGHRHHFAGFFLLIFKLVFFRLDIFPFHQHTVGQTRAAKVAEQNDRLPFMGWRGANQFFDFILGKYFPFRTDILGSRTAATGFLSMSPNLSAFRNTMLIIFKSTIAVLGATLAASREFKNVSTSREVMEEIGFFDFSPRLARKSFTEEL